MAASGKEVNERVAELLELVRMNPSFASRYPHMTVTGAQLRIAGQEAPLPASVTPTAPRPTPPLILGHQRIRGVELVFLAGDVVDTANAPTETEARPATAPAAAPIRRTP